jgi:hypothetical protein
MQNAEWQVLVIKKAYILNLASGILHFDVEDFNKETA